MSLKKKAARACFGCYARAFQTILHWVVVRSQACLGNHKDAGYGNKKRKKFNNFLFLFLMGCENLISYVLTKDVYRRLLRFKGKLVCKKCSKELEIGDKIKGNMNSGTSKLCHSKCYDELFIDIED